MTAKNEQPHPTGAGAAPARARPPRALITGITGQDGSYLTELLIGKGYEVHGVLRRASSFNTQRLEHLYQDPHEPVPAGRGRMILHHGDVTDANILERLVRAIDPDEVYNLAAQSHVRVSFEMPIHTVESVAMGTYKLLEAVRDHQQVTGRAVRVYQASSSEMYGASPAPQNELTAFRPRSPYAIGKLAAHWAAVNYREAYGMHVSCGILFNHESPRRGETFVTRKITRAAGRIKLALQDAVYLGNLDAKRDWGFAGDYVEAMWLMLQQDVADDYVIATGRQMSVRQFAEMAFAEVGLKAADYLRTDARYLRPAEVNDLLGDAGKAQRVLGWKPRTSVDQLVKMMVEGDLEMARREKTLRDAGHKITPRRSGGG
jgi:GDPmannose 4,6-dehydratase